MGFPENLFTVQGKLAGPGVIANWQTGTFGHDLQVTLTGNSRTDGDPIHARRNHPHRHYGSGLRRPDPRR